MFTSMQNERHELKTEAIVKYPRVMTTFCSKLLPMIMQSGVMLFFTSYLESSLLLQMISLWDLTGGELPASVQFR